MTDESRLTLTARLKMDEGFRRLPYVDTAGKLTIGYGHNLTDRGLPEVIIDELLDLDIAEACADLDRVLPWWRGLDEVRQQVLANMSFNMGASTLVTFHETLRAVKEGRYGDAANGMERSLWARQVGARADRLALMMRTGTV